MAADKARRPSDALHLTRSALLIASASVIQEAPFCPGPASKCREDEVIRTPCYLRLVMNLIPSSLPYTSRVLSAWSLERRISKIGSISCNYYGARASTKIAVLSWLY
ncbi:hypothetical protein QBC45DRAFT_429896 [Copromyces sp. CBS 386.78]|nr:hypothetical protein QBC45DRAFT_429896 [Copromyces sp. CBS 386.78]